MRRALTLIVLLISSVVVLPTPASALASVVVTPITFNVIGLDSNDVTTGPNVYPVGARICAAGEDATGVAASFVWDSANDFLQLEGAHTVTRALIGAGTCSDVFFNVVVSRTKEAWLTTRAFHVAVTYDGGGTASTPVPRELFVEKIISQERNSVNSFTGLTSLSIGDVTTYTVDADTAPGGYEQLEAFLTLPSSMFELLSVRTTYGTPTGATNDTVYADACGWDNDPTSATYRSCVGPEQYLGGKAGGDVSTTFTVRAVGAGTVTLSAAIYDQSGSSYHYNSDFGRVPNALVVTVGERPTVPATTVPTPPATTATTSPAAAPVASPEPPAASTSMDLQAAPVQPAPAVAGGATTPFATSPLANTGRDLAAGGGLGLFLTLIGIALLGGLRAVPEPTGPTGLERRVHELRVALYRHESDHGAAEAWALLDALDGVAAALRRR